MGAVRHHNQDINVLIVVAPDLGGRPDSDAGVVRFSDSLALGRASGLGNLTREVMIANPEEEDGQLHGSTVRLIEQSAVSN